MAQQSVGYYKPDYNFSIEYHQGQWVMRSRQPQDLPAQTFEHDDAIESWALSNREKFNG